MKPQEVVQVFNKFSGVVGRVRVGQIKVVNMCSLRLLDTKPTWIHWVGKQATRERWLLRRAIFVIVFFVLFSKICVYFTK